MKILRIYIRSRILPFFQGSCGFGFTVDQVMAKTRILRETRLYAANLRDTCNVQGRTKTNLYLESNALVAFLRTRINIYTLFKILLY